MKSIKIGLVAGEASGDELGAGLIQAFKKLYPNAIFEGIAGPKMIAAGCHAVIPMNKIEYHGIAEVICHIPGILRTRKLITQHFIKNPPDVFIGIDAPDFNLDLELVLKKNGIKTIHYVSPTVWAWRKNRIHKIARAVDHMLTIFPFEKDIYEKHHIPVTFVGHPLADQIPFDINKNDYRKVLGLNLDDEILAILPGSRSLEVKKLTDIFLKTAKRLLKKKPKLKFIVPLVNDAREKQFKNRVNTIAPDLPITYFKGQSQNVIGASDAVLLASGTATLETMLFKKPMVVAYRVSELTYRILSKLVSAKYISIPNLLADALIVPEYVQHDVTVDALTDALQKQMNESKKEVKDQFLHWHQILRQDASQRAGSVVLSFIPFPVIASEAKQSRNEIN